MRAARRPRGRGQQLGSPWERSCRSTSGSAVLHEHGAASEGGNLELPEDQRPRPSEAHVCVFGARVERGSREEAHGLEKKGQNLASLRLRFSAGAPLPRPEQQEKGSWVYVMSVSRGTAAVVRERGLQKQGILGVSVLSLVEGGDCWRSTGQRGRPVHPGARP